MTWAANYSDNRTGETLNHHVSGHDGEAERRCAMPFNPGGHKATWDVKIACCAAVKTIEHQRDAASEAFKRREAEIEGANKVMDERERQAHGDAMRCFATALTHLEAAQMFAVKGLHTRSNAGLPNED